jgi:hypothetical protein
MQDLAGQQDLLGQYDKLLSFNHKVQVCTSKDTVSIRKALVMTLNNPSSDCNQLVNYP